MADASEMPKILSFIRGHATAIWLIYWTVLAGLLHWPKLPRPPIQLSKEGWVAHFTTFSLLSALCLYARIAHSQLTRSFVIRWTLIFMAFGAVSETLQPLTNRHRDLRDFVANASGILAVMGYAYFRLTVRSGTELEPSAP